MSDDAASPLGRLVRFCLEQKLVVGILVVLAAAWAVVVAPFDWNAPWIPRDPVAVDALPDLGDNQQIVFTRWEGAARPRTSRTRSPIR